MNSIHRSVFLWLAALAPLTAQQLAAGKPAPALHVAKWIKGEPVAAFAKDRVYVVEFWATWCGPCIAGMPHLTEIQSRHAAALTVIGVTTEGGSNSLQDVERMVAAKGDTMGYSVAWDDGDKTQKAWLEAAGQDGIPCCFVVDRAGTVVWIGHPQWLDLLLPDVLADRAEPQALAAKITAVEQRMQRVFAAAQKTPAKAIEEAAALGTQYPFLVDRMDEGLFGLILGADDPGLAWPLGEKLATKAIAAKDAEALNTIAWAIVDPAAARKERKLDLAAMAAAKAVELTQRKDPFLLDTLARVHAWKDEWQQALVLQQEAIALLPSGATDARAQLLPALTEYQKRAKPSGG